MSVLGSFVQQPREAIYYTIDYSCWLDTTIPETLDVTPPTVVVTPTTSPVLVATAAVSGDRIKVLVSGGLDGEQYKVEVVVGTSESQIKEDEIVIQVQDH